MVKGIKARLSAFHRSLTICSGYKALGLLALVVFGLSAPAFAKEPRSTTMNYHITRNAEAVGTYRFDMVEDGDSRTVHAVMQIEVRLLGVPIYKASHERRDIWTGDNLALLKGQSRYNGKPYKMEFTRSEGAHLLTVNGVTEKLGAPCFSFVPWLPEGKTSMRLLTEKGRLIEVSISDLGDETLRVGDEKMQLRHYVFRGEWERHGWYDKDGSLAVMTYDLNGAQIRLTRETLHSSP